MQRAEIFVPGHCLLRYASLTARSFCIHLHESIQLWIQFLNADEMRVHQFNRGQLFLADLFSHG